MNFSQEMSNRVDTPEKELLREEGAVLRGVSRLRPVGSQPR